MKNSLLLKIFIAIALGGAAGLLTGTTAEIFGVPFVKIYALIGQLFLNALTLVVVPLVSASIIVGTARMGSEGSFGSLGAKTLGYFIFTNLLAILVGLCVVFLLQPGLFEGNVASVVNQVDAERLATIETQSQGSTFDKFEQIFFKLIPSNILAVAAQGQMLGLIGFSLLFGYFISKIEPHPASIVLGFWKGVFQIMMGITQLVMKALPLGVFGLVAKVLATTGIGAIQSVLYFSLTVIFGLLLHFLIVLPLLLKLVAKVNPMAHFRAMAPALLTGFSTSSSVASLPVMLECVEKRVGVSNRISSFSLPLGTSLNLAGSALHVCIAVLFIAQVYGFLLPPATLFMVVLMTLLFSIGMAGIPSASLVTVVLILHTIGLPSDAIGLILATERILDMFRTVVNVFNNSCCAVLIARSEGEKEILTPTSLTEPTI